MYLNDKEIRALKITCERPAHEIIGHELETLKKPFEYGFVSHTEYRDVFANGKWWKQRQVLITDSGKKYLEKLR